MRARVLLLSRRGCVLSRIDFYLGLIALSEGLYVLHSIHLAFRNTTENQEVTKIRRKYPFRPAPLVAVAIKLTAPDNIMSITTTTGKVDSNGLLITF